MGKVRQGRREESQEKGVNEWITAAGNWGSVSLQTLQGTVGNEITELSPLGVKGVKRLYPQTAFPNQSSVGMSGYGPNMVLSVLFIISTKPYNSMEYWPYFTD